MDGVTAVAQPMPTEVGKPRGEVTAVFAKPLDECSRHEHAGIERPATGFDATGDVDGVADNRQFGPVPAGTVPSPPPGPVPASTRRRTRPG